MIICPPRQEIQKVVKDATQKNLSQAEVIENIKKIGDKAVDLMKKNFSKKKISLIDLHPKLNHKKSNQ